MSDASLNVSNLRRMRDTARPRTRLNDDRDHRGRRVSRRVPNHPSLLMPNRRSLRHSRYGSSLTAWSSASTANDGKAHPATSG